MEKEYIQLPALKRDLDPDVVKALWAFIQLPEKYQARYQEQYELLNQRKEEADRQLQENIEKIDADAIHLYEETISDTLRQVFEIPLIL
jgi:hypothetical protein